MHTPQDEESKRLPFEEAASARSRWKPSCPRRCGFIIPAS
jgi:hypothetical protein